MCNTKKLLLIVTLVLVAVQIASAQSRESFSSFIHRIATADPSRRSAIVDSFMTEQKPNGFPVTSDTIAYFVYRGKVASAIEVTGDYTQWSPNGDSMVNVPATDLYYVARRFEPDARIDYKFIKDGEWILDPANANIVRSGFGQNSELAMPMYIRPASIRFDSTTAHGRISSFTFNSSYTADSRKISVYLPPNYDSTSGRYPSLYVHDGPDYLSNALMANVIDNLIGAKQIRPLIAIFIPSGADRAGEYRLEKIRTFSSLMVKELVPFIDSLYRTNARPAERGTMGSSDGGHISLYLGVNYPDTFGLVGAQSSSITDLIFGPIRDGRKFPVKFYLDVGTYDISTNNFRLLQLNRKLRDLLVHKGYSITYAEYHEGHSWGNWRAHISDILKTFYPYNASEVNVNKGVQ